MAAAEPIRSKKELRRMAGHWLRMGNYRNYTLIVLGVYTALRAVDLLKLKWVDVYDFERGEFRLHVHLEEKKTGKRKTIALNRQAISALKLCFVARKGDYIFCSRKEGRPIGRVQAWRIIKAAAAAIKAVGQISCHSLRKTFGYFAWKAGVLPVMLMDIFNHSSFEVTKRYLGITQDDRDRVYLGMELC